MQQCPAKLHEVARVAGADAQAADHPLEIAHLFEALAEPVQRRPVVNEPGDGLLPLADRFDRRERLRQPVAQPPGAHRRGGAVHRGVECGRLGRLAMERLEDFQMLERGGIEYKVVGNLIKCQPGEVRHVPPQMLADVVQRAAGCADRCRPTLKPEAVESGHLEMILQRELRRFQREHPAFVAVEHADVWLDQPGQRLGLLRVNHLAGVEPFQLGDDGSLVFQLGHLEVAGRQVHGRHTEPAARSGNGDEEIVAPGLEHALVEVCARADDLGDLALDQLPWLGCLDLITDGHLAAGLQQLGHVAAGGVVRDAAHRRVAALGQCDVEDAGRLLGVLEEHLVKVPQAEQQDGPSRQLAFALPVLGHHRG